MKMPFCYDKLWKLLIDKKLNKTKLLEVAGISSATVTAMAKNEYVAMRVLDKICNALDCKIEDVVEHTRENAEE